MENVLNPVLYRLLKNAFGAVKVASHGQSSQIKNINNKISVYGGEYYRVCCPYCGDTKFHLYIHHRYATSEDNKNLDFLLICFRRNCLRERKHRIDFKERLLSFGFDVNRVVIRKGKEPQPGYKPAGKLVSLTKLPHHHDALRYLRGRNFDPEYLDKRYSVRWVEDSKFKLLKNRLVIPIFMNGKLEAWQGRYVGELPWKDKNISNLPPKYFTMPGARISRLLGNFDSAVKCPVGVIVEGWFDAFSIGRCGLVTFGKSLSDEQLRLISAGFSGKKLILLWDHDARGDPHTEKIISQLKGIFNSNFADLWLPDGFDAGSLYSDVIRRFFVENLSHWPDIKELVKYVDCIRR